MTTADHQSWDTFRDKRVLVTGHTGFKGSWLVLWLHSLGAEVAGYALDPPTQPNHFESACIGEMLSHDERADIRDVDRLCDVVRSVKPDFVFHLAAQPIVRESLRVARETFDVNALGTAALLDAVRDYGQPCSVVVITSDKCYRNEGQPWGFRESDPLGGHDPYSASKAAAELVVDSYRASFFPLDRTTEHGVRIASARAGNVIGGGDWAADRILPDAMRALSAGKDLMVRNPASTRPWQHVLEPLSGYLTLGAQLASSGQVGLWDGAWNFGPLPTGEASVARLATEVVRSWGSGRWVSGEAPNGDVEARALRLSIDKAMTLLDWSPRWDFSQTVSRTVEWYRSYYSDTPGSMLEHSRNDIAAFESTPV
jgi:CDP-glucose 4,6-dehydratase